MAAGLPPKPYVPPTAPAPPLPAGPAPQQPAYNAQDPAAAHAAAWAAYYQSQGLTAQGQPQAAAGYAAQPQAGPQQPAGASSNPYANYGYGAQAAQAHLHGGPTAAPGHRPPANVAPQQGYQYNQQQGYASPAPYQQAGPTQGYAGPGAGGYSQPQQGYQAWGQQGGGPGPQQQQAYRPPQGQTYQQGPPGVGPQQPYFNGPGSGPGQQPYTPPHSGGQTPYRHNPSHSPAPMGMSQNRPYQPQPMSGPQSRGPRPPMNQNQGPTPPHHPPAKRPRFDGPGPGPGGGPTHLGGPGRASLPVRPGTGSIPARPPSGPRTPLPPPPITRPPIHLGTGGPPPVFAPGGPRNNAGPMRGGGERGRGRGGMVMNAPRGPSHMRRERQDHQRQRSARSEVSPGKKDSRKDKKKEKEAKTTLTDFRIVGIEMKELGWKWGLVGEEAMNQAEEDEEKAEKIEAEVKTEDVDGEGAASGAAPTAAEPAEAEVKEEIVQSETVNQKETDKTTGPETTADPTIELIEQSVKEEPSAPLEGPEGKTGGKRKAQTPETDEGSSKKRSTYLLTHGKANDAPSHESSQNRFRIYFESPPEADRIPQALRRNPYKRWRREDSAAPASAPAAEEGKKETEGDLPAIEEVGATQEAPTPESSEKVDEAGENAAQNGDVVDQTTETAVPETTEIPSDTLVIEAAEAPTEAEAIPVVDESETIAPVEDAQPEVASAGTTDSGEPAPVPDVVVETDVEVPATAAEQAPVDTEPPKEDELPVPAPAETDSAAAVDAPTSDETPTAVAAPTTATAEETATAIAQSAENAASAYKSRTRRRSSVSSTDSRETQNAFQPEVTPSLNRLSILYEGSQRRMCFDADVVEMIKVYRAEGRIEVCFAPAVKPEPKEGEDDAENVASTSTLLPKGYLLEEYNQEDQRFAPVSRERLQELYAADESSDSIPPLHRHFTDSPNATGLQLSVYLNKKNPLSVPRWCRNNSADEWLYEQFGSRHDGWRSKLQVMDPDPPPTLSSILENWSTSSSSGTSHKRSAFTKSLISEPYDLLEILLRLTRGDRNPTAPGGQGGPLATSIRSDSPYASHQTHVSLAILAMYRLTTDYAEKAGEKSEVVNEKIGDIIKSLPGGMISRSLDGMFKEWDGRGKGGK